MENENAVVVEANRWINFIVNASLIDRQFVHPLGSHQGHKARVEAGKFSFEWKISES